MGKLADSYFNPNGRRADEHRMRMSMIEDDEEDVIHRRKRKNDLEQATLAEAQRSINPAEWDTKHPNMVDRRITHDGLHVQP